MYIFPGKEFSYFASCQSWIKEVFFHPVAPDSVFCILKSECTPSQNVQQIAHNLWVVLEKATGKIKSAYCSCFARYVIDMQYNCYVCLVYSVVETTVLASRPS